MEGKKETSGSAAMGEGRIEQNGFQGGQQNNYKGSEGIIVSNNFPYVELPLTKRGRVQETVVKQADTSALCGKCLPICLWGQVQEAGLDKPTFCFETLVRGENQDGSYE